MTDKALKKARRAGAGRSLRTLLGPEPKWWVERIFHVLLVVALVLLAVAAGVTGRPWLALFAVFLPLVGVAAAAKGSLYVPNATLAFVSVPVTWLIMYRLINMYVSVDPSQESVDLILLLLPMPAAIAPHMWPRPFAATGVSAVLGQLAVLAATAIGIVTGPVIAIIVAFVGILVVNVSRGGGRVWLAYVRARIRSGIHVKAPKHQTNDPRAAAAMDRGNLRRGEQAELQSGAVLETLGKEWTVLHSRALPGTPADADHIVIGPPGAVLVDTKDWEGEITTHLRRPNPDEDESQATSLMDRGDPRSDGRIIEYGINSDRDKMGRVSGLAANEMVAFGRPLALTINEARVVVAFTDRMQFHGPICGRTGTHTKVDLVHINQLAQHLASLPPMPMDLTRRGTRIAAKRGISEDEMLARSRRRYLADLAAALDYLCPPRRG